MKTFITAGLLLLSLFDCKDREQDSTTLPEATQTGANTGGALVDGKVWVAKIEQPNLDPGGNNTQYSLTNGEYNLQIVLRELNNNNNKIVFSVSDNIEITAKNYILTACRLEQSSQIYDVAYGNNIGSLNITKFDKQNKIVSGTFNFEANNINGNGNKIVITEGRFDKKFTN